MRVGPLGVQPSSARGGRGQEPSIGVRPDPDAQPRTGLSAIPRMAAADVVTAALSGIEHGEVVIAPGVEERTLLDTVFSADLAAFHGQSPRLASRYLPG